MRECKTIDGNDVTRIGDPAGFCRFVETSTTRVQVNSDNNNPMFQDRREVVRDLDEAELPAKLAALIDATQAGRRAKPASPARAEFAAVFGAYPALAELVAKAIKLPAETDTAAVGRVPLGDVYISLGARNRFGAHIDACLAQHAAGAEIPAEPSADAAFYPYGAVGLDHQAAACLARQVGVVQSSFAYPFPSQGSMPLSIVTLLDPSRGPRTIVFAPKDDSVSTRLI